jgi:hypothetical protein
MASLNVSFENFINSLDFFKKIVIILHLTLVQSLARYTPTNLNLFLTH